MIKIIIKNSLIMVMVFMVAIITGCGTNSGSSDKNKKKSCPAKPNVDIEVCDPSSGPFSLVIDNPYLPFTIGDQSNFEGIEDGALIELQISVLDEIETVAGIDTRVVEEREWEDGELIEVSRNYFVQAPDGTVCYYGEDVDIYEGGAIVSHEGAWRAGEDRNLPGIMMPGVPAVGQVFLQEFAPGIAGDYAKITAMGDTIDVPAGTFMDTLRTVDTNPFDCEQDTKYYARDVGLIVDAAAELISY